MSTELIIAPSLDGATALENFKRLQAMVKKAMVPNADYYEIRGQKSLSKSGAEKLLRWHGLSVELPESRVTRVLESDFVSYEVVALIKHIATGQIIAEGIGCCNSREKKYRGRDPYDLANTLLKMSKKRAMVDATLTAVAASGMFTQDIGDPELEDVDVKTGEIVDSRPITPASPAHVKLGERYQEWQLKALARTLAFDDFSTNWPLAELTRRLNEVMAAVKEHDAQ